MKRTAVLLPLLLVAALLPLLAGPAVTPPAAAATSGGPSLYVPLDPVRVLDTRVGLGARAGRVGAAQVRDLRVADGVRVPADATAVVLNVTATAPTGPSDVRVYPTPAGDGGPPTVSSLNVVAGTTVANLVTVGLGDGGQVRLRNALGEVHLIADLAGYFTSAPAVAGGSSLLGRAPVRLLDTRAAGGALRAGRCAGCASPTRRALAPSCSTSPRWARPRAPTCGSTRPGPVLRPS